MCKSLSEGGLRCESHLAADMASIKTEYNTGLQKEADEAGVVLDSSIVSKIIEEQKNKIADAKRRLLGAHQLAMEAKSELTKKSGKKEYADYSSIQDDLSDMKSAIRFHFNPFGKKDTKMVNMIERLQNSGIAEFSRGKEYIETVHLAKHCAQQLENFGPQNTPENVAKFKALQGEKDSIDARLDALREDFRSSYKAKYSTDFVEETIVQLPPSNNLGQLVYKNRVEIFHEAKKAYIDESNKMPSDAKSLRLLAKERNGGSIPFEREAIAKYKNDVYDKSDKVVALQRKLRDKKSQIELTPGYRKRLANESKIKSSEGDHVAAGKLLRMKDMLDDKAELTMYQNRMRANN